MKIEGYNGQSTDPNFENYYDITQTNQMDSACFTNPNCRGILGDFTFQMPLGSFSVSAQLALLQNTRFPTVDFVYSQAGGNAIVFYQLHLTNATINYFSQSAEENVDETLRFTFQTVSWKFTSLSDKDGTPVDSVTGCYDKRSNSTTTCTVPAFRF